MNDDILKLLNLYLESLLKSVLTQYDDIINKIQSQYRHSNVNELIVGIIEIKKKYFINAYISLIRDNLCLATAKGDSLDLWGNLLGTNRYIPSDTDNKDYRYFNFDKKYFKQLIFYDPLRPEYASLRDEDFRLMLLLLMQRQFIFPSVKNSNEFLNSFFKKYGGMQIGDNTDMSFVVYYFKKEIPLWLSYFLQYRDILPRPAGVGYNFKTDENYYFGFETDNKEWNETYLGNFYHTNFIPVDDLIQNSEHNRNLNEEG
ncbi:TPA: DUF2612 domain-containing protein [Campylobacter jejuni]|nr:DUF2612 domain-containing protein [Campylobacter jejuni]